MKIENIENGSHLQPGLISSFAQIINYPHFVWIKSYLPCLRKRKNEQQLGNNPDNWLLDSIKRWKLNLHGHAKRQYGLERESYEEIIEGRMGEASLKEDQVKT